MCRCWHGDPAPRAAPGGTTELQPGSPRRRGGVPEYLTPEDAGCGTAALAPLRARAASPGMMPPARLRTLPLMDTAKGARERVRRSSWSPTLVDFGKPRLAGVLAREAVSAPHLRAKVKPRAPAVRSDARSQLGPFAAVSASFLHALQTNMSWPGREREKWERFVAVRSRGARAGRGRSRVSVGS